MSKLMNLFKIAYFARQVDVDSIGLAGKYTNTVSPEFTDDRQGHLDAQDLSGWGTSPTCFVRVGKELFREQLKGGDRPTRTPPNIHGHMASPTFQGTGGTRE